MSLKFLDINYLRAQNTTAGQVLIAGSSLSVVPNSTLVVVNGNVGINTSNPTSQLNIVGNITMTGSSSTVFFPDGSSQGTSPSNIVFPGSISGSVQFNNAGVFGGNSANLFWDNVNLRLGVGTNTPRSSFQIIDVGYESTNTSTSGIIAVILDSFPVPYYRSCHYIVQISDMNYSWFQTSQVMLVHDGITAYQTEYNIVITYNKMGEISSQISGGNVELLFTPFYTSDKNIKVIRTSIEP